MASERATRTIIQSLFWIGEGRRSAWEGLYTKRTETSRYEIKRKRGGERRERREGGREERERGREERESERELMVATWRLRLLFTQGTVLGVLTPHEISKAQCWGVLIIPKAIALVSPVVIEALTCCVVWEHIFPLKQTL